MRSEWLEWRKEVSRNVAALAWLCGFCRIQSKLLSDASVKQQTKSVFSLSLFNGRCVQRFTAEKTRVLVLLNNIVLFFPCPSYSFHVGSHSKVCDPCRAQSCSCPVKLQITKVKMILLIKKMTACWSVTKHTIINHKWKGLTESILQSSQSCMFVFLRGG